MVTRQSQPGTAFGVADGFQEPRPVRPARLARRNATLTSECAICNTRNARNRAPQSATRAAASTQHATRGVGPTTSKKRNAERAMPNERHRIMPQDLRRDAQIARERALQSERNARPVTTQSARCKARAKAKSEE